MKNYWKLLFCTLFAGLLFIHPCDAQKSANQNTSSGTPLEKRIKELRTSFFSRDFTTGFEIGQDLIRQFPEADELRMWVILNGARSSGDSQKALDMAKEFVALRGETTWSFIALTMAYNYRGEASNASDAAQKLIKLSPDNEEAIFCYNSVLFRQAKYPDSVAWLEKNDNLISDRSRFYSSMAISRYQLPNGKPKAFEDFKRSVELDPRSVNSLYLYGEYLNREKRHDEALVFLKKATKLAPNVSSLRFPYWKTIRDQTSKSEIEKDREVIADMDAYLKKYPNTPGVMHDVALQYGIMSRTTERTKYEDDILRRFGNTKYAEPILIARIIDLNKEQADKGPSSEFVLTLSELVEARLLGDKSLLDKTLGVLQPDIDISKRLAAAWEDFVRRPKHFDETHLGTAYFSLFLSAKYDFGLTDERLNEFIPKVKRYKNDRHTNTNREIADFLAVRKVFGLNPKLTQDALEYARAGISEAESDIADYGLVLSGQDLERQAKYIRSNALQTLGNVLYLEKQYDEAEAMLKKALEVNTENTDVFLNLALLHRERKEFDKAEELYLKSATISRPFKTSFIRLYEARTGNTDGFDEYYLEIREKVRAKVRIELTASRIKEPKATPPFNLKTIDDRNVSFDSLKGKVVVINFWGVWCGPCVKEMPEIQELHEKYRNDPDVAILTFNSGDELATVRKFIADRKYDFQVLLADSYTENLEKVSDGMTAYPTTFFIDKSGKISFLKIGNTGNLLEEFSLRIDILKQDKVN